MFCSILLLQEAEPLGCHLHQVGKVTLNLLQFCFQTGYEFISLVLVELQDASHLDLHQLQDVVSGHLTHKLLIERLQTGIHILNRHIHVLGILKFLRLIDAFLNEDFLQRTEMQLFQEFTLANLQFPFDKILRVIDTLAQHITHSEELRHTVVDDTAVGRDADFTIREGIEGINRLVARCTRHQVDDNLHTSSRQVFHFTCLDLALLNRFQDGVNELARLRRRTSRFAKRNLRDGKSLVVSFLNLGTYTNRATTLTIIVL